MMSSALAYTQLRQNTPASVRVIAVSKKQTVAEIESVYAAGCLDFAENYLQEALPKIRQIQHPDLRWHFIGHLQSNKLKEIAAHFDVVQSIDRLELASKLNAICEKLNKIMPIFIQVNLDHEPQKSGVLPPDLPAVLLAIKNMTHLDLEGLMLIPAIGNAAAFSGLRALRERMLLQTGMRLPRLSMGMSRDYPLAIAEGATDVRIGEAIFGSRLN
ncbi:MAG: YggS family pyridoxal phosphate-dependent enzyme [Gammaproteobacteria bacterium]|nr:YggS family pyridoxal phosphate-dependent enzyme [Gammaproteobacteria bacterium]